jgi:hypothetical protein
MGRASAYFIPINVNGIVCDNKGFFGSFIAFDGKSRKYYSKGINKSILLGDKAVGSNKDHHCFSWMLSRMVR